VLENTWLILTSDHGELFERGLLGHGQPAFYAPELRIPLLIFQPGRVTRLDIHAPTSTIDLLPTLLQITGHPPAAGTEGAVLPPFSLAPPDRDRSLFAASTLVRTWREEPLAPLDQATCMLVRGGYKLTYFFGYPQLDGQRERIELYDTQNDPEELNDLRGSKPGIASEMLAELKSQLERAEAPYR